MKDMLSYLFLALVLMPSAALAHSGAGGGFSAGLFHPVLGLDHFLAMVSVGIISTQLGGRAILTVPGAFVAAMVVGGFIGIETPLEAFASMDVMGMVELGIAASVLLLGLAIALERSWPVVPTMGFVAFFGIFHGYAHGVEIPLMSMSLHYVAGFVCGTALLHLLGVAIGLAFERLPHGRALLRYGGAMVAGMGLLILLQFFGF